MVLLAAALVLTAGAAYAQQCICADPVDPGAGETVTVTLCDGGEQFDLWNDIDFIELCFWIDATEEEICFWGDEEVFSTGVAIFELTAEMLEADGLWMWGTDDAVDLWLDLPDFLAGGDCDPCCVGAAAEVSVSISGPHILDIGDPLVLEAAAEGFDEVTAWEWWKDGGILAETSDTLTVASATADDSGTYTAVAIGTVGGEPVESEASFLVMVGYATPLAGGLGLGLMAGACALAGAVAIRRKK
jgi:hypothetical protein